MNSRERVAAAMRLERPDRVPVMCQPSIGFLLAMNPDVSPLDLWHDQTVYAEALCSVSKRFGFDGVLISMLGNCPLYANAIEHIDRDYPEGPRVAYKNGDQTVYCRNDLPRHTYARHEPANIETFDPNSIADRLRMQPVSNNLNVRIADDPAERVRVVHEVRRRMGAAYSVHGEMYSPNDYFIELFGVENAMTALLTHPDKSREIMLCFAHAVARFGAEQIDAGVDAMKISSPWTGQTFIPLSIYEDIIVPSQAVLAQVCHERGIPVYCHTCGAIDDRLEAIIDTGMNGIECLDPPPLGNVELADAVKRIGDHAFIKGNVDPVNVLCNGTLEAIEDDVKRRLQIGMQARGYILSTACSMAPATPPEHVALLAPLAREFGVYY